MENGLHNKRRISKRLKLGIILFPLVFSWFTLRKGYSISGRVVSLVWALVYSLPVVVLVATFVNAISGGPAIKACESAWSVDLEKKGEHLGKRTKPPGVLGGDDEESVIVFVYNTIMLNDNKPVESTAICNYNLRTGSVSLDFQVE